MEIIVSMTSPMGVETGRSVLSVIQMTWFEIYVGQVFCSIAQGIIYIRESGRLYAKELLDVFPMSTVLFLKSENIKTKPSTHV